MSSEGLCCYNCRNWCGRCTRGRQNVFARSPACDEINKRGGVKT